MLIGILSDPFLSMSNFQNSQKMFTILIKSFAILSDDLNLPKQTILTLIYIFATNVKSDNLGIHDLPEAIFKIPSTEMLNSQNYYFLSTSQSLSVISLVSRSLMLTAKIGVYMTSLRPSPNFGPRWFLNDEKAMLRIFCHQFLFIISTWYLPLNIRLLECWTSIDYIKLASKSKLIAKKDCLLWLYYYSYCIPDF